MMGWCKVFMIAALLTFAKAFYGQGNSTDISKNRIELLKTSAFLINDTSASNSFEFLLKSIGDKRIVFLGEQNHLDGTTHHIKFEIIKYLHEYLGFNVLVDELPLSQVYWIDQQSLSQTDFVVGNSRGLNFTDDLRRRYNYIYDQKFTSMPLKYFGVDNDALPDIRYFEKIISRVDVHLLKTPEWSSFKLSLELNNLGKRDIINRDELKTSITFLADRVTLSESLSEYEKKFFLKIINQWVEWIDFLQTIPSGFFTALASSKIDLNQDHFLESLWVRDSLMAENFKWLEKNFFPGEKVIVNVSSYHAAKDIEQVKLFNKDIRRAIPMAVRINDMYQGETYSVAFIRAQGFFGIANKIPDSDNIKVYRKGKQLTPGSIDSVLVRKIPAVKPQSMEGILSATGAKFGFVDLLNSKNSWLAEDFEMNPTFYYPYKVRWREVYDGLFFIRDMQPIVTIRYDTYYNEEIIKDARRRLFNIKDFPITRSYVLTRKQARKKRKESRNLFRVEK